MAARNFRPALTALRAHKMYATPAAAVFKENASRVDVARIARYSHTIQNGTMAEVRSAATISAKPDRRRIQFASVLKKLLDGAGGAKARENVAHELGVTKGALSQYITNKNLPTFRRLVALSRHFGVSLD